MVRLPAQVAYPGWHARLCSVGLKQAHCGKVRHTYCLENKLLMVASDRVSIFDIVLGIIMPRKGEYLTALTVHWLTKVLKGIPHHLVAFGEGIDKYLPASLRGNSELRRRALVVLPLKMAPVECVVRGYLTGSGWASYQKTGMVCGHKLPAGLYDGAKLHEPIFTPTTKAEEGHDLHLDAGSVNVELAQRSLAAYARAAGYAAERGVVLADTKFEWSVYGALGNEVLTPDSSRFWDYNEWWQSSADKKSPASYDKEVIRQWGKSVETPWGKGLNNLDPTKEEHVAFAQSLVVPQEVINRTEMRYNRIFKRLTGLWLDDYQYIFLKT